MICLKHRLHQALRTSISILGTLNTLTYNPRHFEFKQSYAAFATARLARPDHLSEPAGQRGRGPDRSTRPRSEPQRPSCPECNQLENKHSLVYHTGVINLNAA